MTYPSSLLPPSQVPTTKTTLSLLFNFPLIAKNLEISFIQITPNKIKYKIEK